MKAVKPPRTYKRQLKQSVLSSTVIAVLLGLVFSVGMELRANEGLGFSWGKRLLCFAAVSTVCYGIFGAHTAVSLMKQRNAQRPVGKGAGSMPRFLPLWGLFFACAMPALLAYCPGIVAYDATAQILQGVDGAYTTHHPVLHTLLLSGCVRLGRLIHSYTLGAGLYSLLQMAGLSALLALCVRALARLGASRFALRATVCFYALYPVHAIMAISTTKDTLFAGLVALLMLRTIEMLRKGPAVSRRMVLSYIALAAAMCLWRNNGVYALIVMAVLGTIAGRGIRVRFMALMLMCVLAYAGVQSGLARAMQVRKSSSLEMLGVPIAQMARVAKLHGGELPDEIADELEAYMPLGDANPYAAHLVDPVKMAMDKDAFSRDPAAFVSLWARLGRLYPQDYIEAALLLNQGMWDPLDISHAHVYDMWEAGQHGYLQTKFQRHIDDARGIRMEQKSLLPGVWALYERFCTQGVQLKSPVTRIFFAPAGMVLVCMIAMIRFFAQGRRAEGIASTLLLGVLATQLLGPCALVRYAYPFFVSAPLLMSLARKNE